MASEFHPAAYLAPSDSAAHPESQGYQPKQLVLLGAGLAHLQVMAQLAAQPLVGARIILIAPNAEHVMANRLPGFVAGDYTLEQCTVPVEPLVRRCGIRWLSRSVKALDAHGQTVSLDDGTTVHYDWLSVNTSPVQNKSLLDQQLPGARQFGLFVRPLEIFCKLWPQVVDLGSQRALRIVVIGAGLTGMELAMAVHSRLPNAAVTLVSGPTPFAGDYSAAVQHRLVASLKSMNVTVLPDDALEIVDGAARLGCGAMLACDVPVIAMGTHAPGWLAASGLSLDASGFLAVDAFQRSTSHPQVFAVGGACARTDQPAARGDVPGADKGGVYALNLYATVSGGELQAYAPVERSLRLLSCGSQSAIASWGGYSAQGRWVWWLKHLLDRRVVQRYRTAASPP